MQAFCPVYPPPRKTKAAVWRAFFGARHSWLDGLYERSYAMHMGQISLINSTLFMVNQPSCIHQVMVGNEANYPKHDAMHTALHPLLGDSIFTTNGAQWQRQRQMMNPAFAQARVQVAFTHMQQATNAMLQRVAHWDMTQPHDVQDEMTLVAADVIFRTIFSQGMDVGHAKRIFDAFQTYQTLSPKITLPAVYGLKWLVPFWLSRRSQKAAQEIRSLLADMIATRFAVRDALPENSPSDILASLLQARDADTGERFTSEELLNQVTMLFLAGHETSASALSWALHLLANTPDVQTRMRQELQQVAGNAPLQAEQLKALKLTWNVFRETLRLFPPVGFFARSVLRPDTMRDKSLKAGDTVVVSPWLLHRHRTLWQEPDAFLPDRFTQPAGRASAREAYIPFGDGPRVCIGASFAMQEAALILSTIIRAFKIEPAPPHVPQPVGRMTIRSANGIWVRLTPHTA
jgi:cytochrome P450